MADYGFVRYTDRREYDRSGKKTVSGYYEILVTAQQNLRIGSGFSGTNPQSMKAEIMRSNGAPVIPGSSLKGCVRSIAAAISQSCLPKPADNEQRSENQKIMASHTCKTGSRCIICDMFGMMGFASRVDFGDLKAPANTRIDVDSNVPVPFPPNARKDSYYDSEGSKGYKFYNTVNKPAVSANGKPPAKYCVEAVPKGTVFTGRVYFHDLTEEQLSLLLFSLGCDGSFYPKLGGNRAHCYGSVSVQLGKTKHYIGETPSRKAAELAKAYPEEAPAACRESIRALRNILKKENI